METSSSSWMKCQHHHHHSHSFPIEIPKPLSSFNCRRNSAYAPRQTSIHLSSSKSNYWAIKSTNKDAITQELLLHQCRKQRRRRMITGTVTAASSIGLVVMLMGHDNKAWALGPEGPLVEEFWENVRRYALYALTVSTGVLYAVLQPIVELLKNPISAVLVIVIFAATFFIFSQVLSAMFGVSDFAYQYAY